MRWTIGPANLLLGTALCLPLAGPAFGQALVDISEKELSGKSEACQSLAQDYRGADDPTKVAQDAVVSAINNDATDECSRLQQQLARSSQSSKSSQSSQSQSSSRSESEEVDLSEQAEIEGQAVVSVPDPNVDVQVPARNVDVTQQQPKVTVTEQPTDLQVEQERPSITVEVRRALIIRHRSRTHGDAMAPHGAQVQKSAKIAVARFRYPPEALLAPA